MRTHIVYIPGLGSNYDGFRRLALKLWRIYGVSAELTEINWYDNKDFDQKMRQVKQSIENASPHVRIIVIGESAGATLALHAATFPRVSRVITLCGVAQASTPISSYLQKKSPALFQATRSIPDTKVQNIHSIRAIADPVVGKKYSTAAGARSHIVWTVGHLSTIVICLTILAPLMLTIAKKTKT